MINFWTEIVEKINQEFCNNIYLCLFASFTILGIVIWYNIVLERLGSVYRRVLDIFSRINLPTYKRKKFHLRRICWQTRLLLYPMIFLRDVCQIVINFFSMSTLTSLSLSLFFSMLACSPPKQSVVPVHAHNDYPTQAVQKTHEKPMPTHEMRQHTCTKPTIHQPRKWTPSLQRWRAHKTGFGDARRSTCSRIILILY